MIRRLPPCVCASVLFVLCAAPLSAGSLDLGPITLHATVNPNGTPNLGTGLLVNLDLEGLNTHVSLGATATHTVNIDAPNSIALLRYPPHVQRRMEANIANIIEADPNTDYARDDSQWSDRFTEIAWASNVGGGEAGNDVEMRTATVGSSVSQSVSTEDIGYFVTTGGIELSGTAYVGIKLEILLPLPADANNDGTVNGNDKGIISHAMLFNPTSGGAADVNQDGIVDGLDVNIFAETFLESGVLNPPLLDVTGFRHPFHVHIATDGTITNLLPQVSGDVNLDGTVNGLDANIISADFLENVVPYTNGDLNGDGVVNGLDANIMSANWLAGSPASAIPEPHTFTLLVLGATFLCGCRRRRR